MAEPFQLWEAFETGGFPHVLSIISAAQEGQVRGSLLAEAMRLVASRGTVEQAHELINLGAAIDVPDPENKRTPLLTAASSDNFPMVEFLLAAGANVNAADCDGETALLCAIANLPKSKRSVKCLLDCGADINAKNTAGRTPLFLAVFADDAELVQILEGLGADPNVVDWLGSTPLFYAVESYEGHGPFSLAVIRALINASRIDLRFRVDDETPLIHSMDDGRQTEAAVALLQAGVEIFDDGPEALARAIDAGNDIVVQALLSRGCSLDESDEEGRTPREIAAEGEHLEIAQLVASITRLRNEPPLLRAAMDGDGEAVRQILASGVDVDLKNELGDTALILASQGGHVDVARYLVASGADINHKNRLGYSPIVAAAAFNSVSVLETVAALLDLGANINSSNLFGNSALSYALGIGCRTEPGPRKLIDLLLEKGADVNVRDARGGVTPLSQTSWWEIDEVMIRLIERGADVSASPQALINVVQRRKNEWIERLIRLGVDVDYRDGQGRSALFYAALDGNEEAVAILLRHGARFDYRSNLGTPVLHASAEMGHPEVARLLLNAGADVNLRGRNGETILYLFSHNNVTRGYFDDFIQDLIDRGAELVAPNT